MISLKDIKSIGVIGGGTAGYFSALYLKKMFPAVDITLIESSRIPVIGVGEASTSLLQKFMHKYMEWPVQEVFQKVKPTLKLGIKFHWGKKGSGHYNFPFGPSDTINALYHTGSYNNNSLAAMLMELNKGPFLRQGDSVLPLKVNKGYAYHIDNETLIGFLKTKLAESGCRHVDTEITSAHPQGSGDGIEAVLDKDGRRYAFDLFIDCSGFRSLLLGKTLGARWVDYSPSLRTNRAVTGVQDHDGRIKPYTTSTTMNHGWLWTIPTQTEDHLGYVFSARHCSDDEALSELRGHCRTVMNERVIHFKSGRYDRSWNSNVVGIGNAFAFVEPLESTGIHMIILQLRTLAKQLAGPEPLDSSRDRYNGRINDAWDNIRYFIAVHFKHNERLDTPFWKECRDDLDVSGVQDYLTYFKEYGPIFLNASHPLNISMKNHDLFGGYAYDGILAGSGVNAAFFAKKNSYVNEEWPRLLDFQRAILDTAITHEESLRYLSDTPTTFIADWFETPGAGPDASMPSGGAHT